MPTSVEGWLGEYLWRQEHFLDFAHSSQLWVTPSRCQSRPWDPLFHSVWPLWEAWPTCWSPCFRQHLSAKEMTSFGAEPLEPREGANELNHLPPPPMIINGAPFQSCLQILRHQSDDGLDLFDSFKLFKNLFSLSLDLFLRLAPDPQLELSCSHYSDCCASTRPS